MAKEKQEYDYEGDMAMSQLKSIIANAQRIHDMLERDTNIPEWVQSKITLAEDYITTAANYMQGEMKEAYSKINPKHEVGLNSFSSKDAAMKHAKKMEDKGYLTRYSMGSTDYRSSQSHYPHQITHYFRDNDHKNEYRRQKYAEKKKIKEDVDTYADALIKRNKQNLNKGHVVNAARIAGMDDKKLMAAVNKKVGRIKEEVTHSVHVKTYDSHGEKQMNSPEFKKHVTAHGGEMDYVSDKGAAFKFASHSHAAAFHRGVQSKFRELDSEHDMHEDVAMGTGPVNVAANVADPQNKKLFAKPAKRKIPSFKSFAKK